MTVKAMSPRFVKAPPVPAAPIAMWNEPSALRSTEPPAGSGEFGVTRRDLARVAREPDVDALATADRPESWSSRLPWPAWMHVSNVSRRTKRSSGTSTSESRRRQPRRRIDRHVFEFLCECSNIDCTLRLPLTLAAYERVRVDPTQFVVAPGHDLPEIEDVVHRADGYQVVRKHGEAAELAEDRDPRS
jgi:hypothetical protein